MDNRPIGVFDSGMGGLTCIPYLRKLLPKEKLIYFGDTDRAPYGSKSVKKLERYSKQIVQFLMEQDVKLIIIACNTVSATCLDVLHKAFPDTPILGIIEPIAEKLADQGAEPVNVGVIATRATINSGVYVNLITSRNKYLRIFSQSCPLFVPIIEEGLIGTVIADETIRYYLDDFIRLNELQKLILGCTHYPLLAEKIGQIYPEIELLNPALDVSLSAKAFLTEHDLLADTLKPAHLCYASDLTGSFSALAENVFGSRRNVTLLRKKLEEE